MPTTTDIRVNDLIINKMTQEQYDALPEKSPTELYVVEGDSNVIYAEQAIELPTAGENNLGKLYQYIGITDQNYTQNYFYKCISTGDPAVYSWTQVNVQPAADPLPSQSGNSGKFLTTNGTNASWSDKPLVNTATGSNSLTVLGTIATAQNATNIGIGSVATHHGDTAIGYGATATGQQEYSTAVGYNSKGTGRRSVCVGGGSWSTGDSSVSIGSGARAQKAYSINIGYNTQSDATHAIQLGGTGSSATINSDANTFKVANANGNFELMSADGTIPKERLANVISMPATMPQLTVAGWSSNTQTVNVTGVTANNVVFVSPAPLSTTEYAQCGVACIAQAAGTLTFTCTTVPENALTVNVVCL